MGKIFYIIGKSSSGKDTIFKRIKNTKELSLESIVPYTTRPIRDGEREGVQYHFVSEGEYEELEGKGVVIESRVYHTVYGDWRYFTVDDGGIDLEKNSYLAIGVPEACGAFERYFGKSYVEPIYIEVDDGERLQRALERERRPENQKYAEMCRRFLADLDDFAEDKIEAVGINDNNRFTNDESSACAVRIVEYIKGLL